MNLTDFYMVKTAGEFKNLQKHKVPLTPEERSKVVASKAVWGDGRPAVWKSVNNGKTCYVTNTHRAFNKRPTLAGAIGRFHSFIKGTA